MSINSKNAFAAAQNGHSRPGNGTTEERPSKRVRLAEDAIASIHGQTTQSDVSLEVDHMILDYVAFHAIEACLASRHFDRRSGSSQSLSASLAMSDAFLPTFKARHPSYKPDPELNLRILLMKFTALFTQRFTVNPATPSVEDLRQLRASNQDRARSWISNADRIPSASVDTAAFDEALPIPDQGLERNRAHVLHQLGLPAENDHYEDAFYGTANSVTLLDLISSFMQLSAARNAMSGSNLKEYWMRFASELMLQACLEQYMVRGVHGSDAIDETFAWGYKDVDHSHSTANGGDGGLDEKEAIINAMFEDEDYEVEVEGWTEVKNSYLKLLIPVTSPADRDPSSSPPTANGTIPSPDLRSHLESITVRYPIEKFEASMLNFLCALADSIPQPVLVQLESGQLDDMTQDETANFLKECGLGVESFFEPPLGFKGLST